MPMLLRRDPINEGHPMSSRGPEGRSNRDDHRDSARRALPEVATVRPQPRRPESPIAPSASDERHLPHTVHRGEDRPNPEELPQEHRGLRSRPLSRPDHTRSSYLEEVEPEFIADDRSEIHAEDRANAYLRLYRQPHEVTLRALSHSMETDTIQEVLKANADNRGEHWNTRSFWVLGVITAWASKLNSFSSERAVSKHLRELEKLQFPTRLKEHDEVVLGEVWEEFRGGLITKLRDAFRAGCAWEHIMQRMLNASKDKKRGNKRIESILRKFLSDPTLYEDSLEEGGGYALLGADVFLWQLDESYATINHGPQAASNAWALCTQFEEAEAFDTLGKRILSTYAKFIGLDENQVHKDDHHRAVLFRRVGECLRQHKIEKLGRMAFAFWDDGVRACHGALRDGTMTKDQMSVDFIMRKYVTREKTKMEEIVTMCSNSHELSFREPTTREPRRSNRLRQEGGEQPRLRPHSRREEVNVVAASEDDRDTDRDSDSGRQAAAVTPQRMPSYNRAPPPGYSQTPTSQMADREKKWGRECEAPAGSKGHPTGKNWATSEDWRRTCIDYDKLIKLAHEPRYHDMMCKVLPLTREMNSCRKEMPRMVNGAWGPVACAFCLNRPPDDKPFWRSGSGEGGHIPRTCRVFKRFLAEGGDNQTAGMRQQLQQCLMFIPPRENRGSG